MGAAAAGEELQHAQSLGQGLRQPAAWEEKSTGGRLERRTRGRNGRRETAREAAGLGVVRRASSRCACCGIPEESRGDGRTVSGVGRLGCGSATHLSEQGLQTFLSLFAYVISSSCGRRAGGVGETGRPLAELQEF